MWVGLTQSDGALNRTERQGNLLGRWASALKLELPASSRLDLQLANRSRRGTSSQSCTYMPSIPRKSQPALLSLASDFRKPPFLTGEAPVGGGELDPTGVSGPSGQGEVWRGSPVRVTVLCALPKVRILPGRCPRRLGSDGVECAGGRIMTRDQSRSLTPPFRAVLPINRLTPGLGLATWFYSQLCLSEPGSGGTAPPSGPRATIPGRRQDQKRGEAGIEQVVSSPPNGPYVFCLLKNV